MRTAHRVRRASPRRVVKVLVDSLENRLFLASEFNGPLAGWLNVKTQYGAYGDGIHDDTAAIQAALHDAGATNWQMPSYSPVVYLPSGTYRITQELIFHKEDDQGVLIKAAGGTRLIGEDPTTTVVSYDGATGGNLIHALDSRRWEVSRLTLDGNDKAARLIYGDADGQQGAVYNGSNTIHDNIFREAQVGIQGGHFPYNSIAVAEMSIQRNQFLGINTGIFISGFNSLNWWIWDCTFVDNEVGVGTSRVIDGAAVMGAGDLHVQRSVFVNSSYSDILLGHLAGSVIEGNFSTGSKRFIDSYGPWGTGYLLAVKNNTVLDTQTRPIYFHTFTPLTLLDNTFRYNGAAVEFGASYYNGVSVPAGQLLAVGNRYSYAGVHSIGGTHTISLDEQIVDLSGMSATPPAPAAFTPHVSRPVVEVTTLTGQGIQQAIDYAIATYGGQRPVVHIPYGYITATETITIPPMADVQLVGDGFDEAHGTMLLWGGVGGTVLDIQGPSHVVVKDLIIAGVPSTTYPYLDPLPPQPWQMADTVIQIGNADQPGGRIFFDRVATGALTSPMYPNSKSLVWDQMDNTHLEAHDTWVNLEATGGTRTAVRGADAPQVALFSSNAGGTVSRGANVLFDGIYWEGLTTTADSIFSVKDNGRASVMQMKFGYYTDSQSTHAIVMHDVSGSLTVLNANLVHVDHLQTNLRQALVDGDAPTQFLLANSAGGPAPIIDNTTNPSANVAGLNNIAGTTHTTLASPGQGSYDEAWLRRMLKDIRNTHPQPTPSSDLATGVTDVQFYRVFTYSGRTGIRISSGQRAQYDFDETSGSTAADATLNAHNGTLNGAVLPTWTDGPVGGAIQFNGSNYVSIPAADDFDTLGADDGDFSLAFWMRLDQSPTGTWRAVIHKGDAITDHTPNIALGPDNRLYASVTTSGEWTEGRGSVNPLPTGQWVHVAMVKSGNGTAGNPRTIKLYLNGALDNTCNIYSPTVANNGGFYLGKDLWNAGPVMAMDDLRIFNGHALSLEEVQALGSLGASAPQAPAGLSAAARSSTQINLNWTAASTNHLKFEIDRATDAGFTQNLVTLSGIGADQWSYSDTGLSLDTAYFYRIRAINDAGASANSAIAPAGTSAFSAPAELTLTPTSATQINVSWSAVSGNVSGYNVYRTTKPGTYNFGTPLNGEALVSGTFFSDTTAAPNTMYYYVVRAVGPAGESPLSAEAGASGKLSVPTGLLATASSAERRIDLSWTGIAGTGITGYQVFRGTTPGGESITPISPLLNDMYTSYSDTDVTPGTTYYYVIKTVNFLNAGSTSSASAEVGTVLAEELKTYWRLDETSGTTIVDSAEYGSNSDSGTLVNGPTRIAGLFGSALQFDGVNDYVQIAHSSDINPTQAITVSVWARSTNATFNKRYSFVSKRNAYLLGPGADGTTKITFQLYIGGGWRSVTYATGVDLTQWHHYVGTYDGSTIRLYVDGVQVASTPRTGAINADSGNLMLGRDDGYSRYFKGALDDVRIYSAALSSGNIEELYQQGESAMAGMAATSSGFVESISTSGRLADLDRTFSSESLLFGGASDDDSDDVGTNKDLILT